MTELQSFGEKEPGVYEYSVEGAPGKDLRRDLFACCARKGTPILALKSSDLSLEDVFLRLTSDSYIPKGLDTSVYQKPAEAEEEAPAAQPEEPAPAEDSEEEGGEEE